MCVNAVEQVAEKALKAAEAQWDLIAMIKAEANPRGVVIAARKMLQARRDDLALDIFDSVTQQPDMDRARALVESATREEGGG